MHSEKSKSFVGSPLKGIFVAPYHFKRVSLHVARNDLSHQITRFSFQLLSTHRIVMASCVSSLTRFGFSPRSQITDPQKQFPTAASILTLMMMYCLGRGRGASLEDRLSARPGQKSVTPAPSVGVLTTLPTPNTRLHSSFGLALGPRQNLWQTVIITH